jgi:hypothetical protein
VRFVGESVDDVGGGYSESIAEMCEELQSGVLPLFILTPNGRVDNGVNRDCYLFNPAATSPEETNMFRFLGELPASSGHLAIFSTRSGPIKYLFIIFSTVFGDLLTFSQTQ